MKFKLIKNFRDHYELVTKLGQGGFGTVFSGLHRRSQTPCAIKQISKASLDTDRKLELNRNEFEIMEEITHPHIVRTFELLEDTRNYYIIMEVMKGGNLMDKIAARRSGFNEHAAASVIHQLLLAINYMHDH